MLRPSSLDLPLFLHVLGAMLLVGALIAALCAFVLAGRSSDGTDGTLRRFGFKTLLLAGIPAFLLMRIDAQWIYSREIGSGGHDPDWVGIGFMISDVGALLLIVTCILAWRAAKKATGGGLAQAATILTGVMLVAYLVAMWAMTAKPGT